MLKEVALGTQPHSGSVFQPLSTPEFIGSRKLLHYNQPPKGLKEKHETTNILISNEIIVL